MAQPVDVVSQLGGFATWAQLHARCSRRQVRAALAAGLIVRLAPGHYALPLADQARQVSVSLHGITSHTSAALHWGWPVAFVPDLPVVTVARKRRIAASRRAHALVHWRDLSDSDVCDGWVTSPVRTVIDCCLDLPRPEALTVFDSAWRAGLKPRDVQRAARFLPPRQRDKVWRLAQLADPRAANPFESVLRSIAIDVVGLAVEPQVEVKDSTFYARVDLADGTLLIAVEAESFEFHGRRKEFARDCRRYNGLVVRGWLVLRFTWEEVMFDPDRVREVIHAAVALRRTRPTGTRRRTGLIPA